MIFLLPFQKRTAKVGIIFRFAKVVSVFIIFCFVMKQFFAFTRIIEKGRGKVLIKIDTEVLLSLKKIPYFCI
jgi:hypothetical protein